MLNPHLQGGTVEPDGRGAPEVSVDGRTWRCRADVTGHRGRFRPQTAFWCCSEAVARAILPTKCR